MRAKKKDVLKRLKRRENYNKALIDKFKNLQLPLVYKIKKSHFIIKNNFTKKLVNKSINEILKKINNERNYSRY